MYSACGNAALPALGFPIRESTDHGLFSVSPWLIAAVHALHRLLVPRHPPCALPILTVIAASIACAHETDGDTRWLTADRRDQLPVGMVVQFSRTAQEAPAGLAVGLSKLNSMRDARPKARAQRLPSRPRRRAQAVASQIRSTLLGPAGSARHVVRREGRSGAPILEASLERR